MATAHNVKDMTPRDGKFRFRLRTDGAARIVWGYVIEAGPYRIVKLDGEHTYLWVNDPRIEQIILELLNGGTYAERAAAHEETILGCHAARSDGECIWAKCPQLRDNEPATTGRHCPLDKLDVQEAMDLEA